MLETLGDINSKEILYLKNILEKNNLKLLKNELNDLFKNKNFTNFLEKKLGKNKKQIIVDSITSLILYIDLKIKGEKPDYIENLDKKIKNKINTLLNLLN